MRISGSIASLVLALTLGAAAAHAQWAGWDYEYDQEKKTWKEMQAQIPPYPKTQTLIPFEGGAASPHRYFIDASSISVGEDGVVRYTVVIRTAGGATNVSFEGMRCDQREQKTYALGRADGTWVRARDPQWRKISNQEFNRHHVVLYIDHFCPSQRHPATVKQALQNLRYGKPVEPIGN